LTNTCTYCGAFLPGRMIGDLGPVKTCTKCGRENGPLAGTCSFCGGELIPAEGDKMSTPKTEERKPVKSKWCPNCGAPVIEGAKNCLCGFTFEEEANV